MKKTTQQKQNIAKPFVLTYEENNYDVYVNLNYNYASSVQVQSIKNEYWVGWSQFENCIYFGRYENDEEVVKSLYLTETELLVPDFEEVKQMLNNLPIPSEFPFDILLAHIKIISNCILQNHKQYWNEWRAQQGLV